MISAERNCFQCAPYALPLQTNSIKHTRDSTEDEWVGVAVMIMYFGTAQLNCRAERQPVVPSGNCQANVCWLQISSSASALYRHPPYSLPADSVAEEATRESSASSQCGLYCLAVGIPAQHYYRCPLLVHETSAKFMFSIRKH